MKKEDLKKGEYVRFKTKKDGVYGGEEDFGIIDSFNDGSIMFRSIVGMMAGKYKGTEEKEVDFETIEKIDFIPIDFFKEVVEQAKVLIDSYMENNKWEVKEDYITVDSSQLKSDATCE